MIFLTTHIASYNDRLTVEIKHLSCFMSNFYLFFELIFDLGKGIMAVIPEVGTVAVWSPQLNKAGNSLAGTLALEWFSKRSGVNIF